MKKAAVALIACFVLVYILPLGVRKMIIPDETRYAEIPREMIATGDWVSPRLAGVRYFEKPVLGYWLNAVSMSIFGDNRFACRLPAAAAAGLSALLVFLVARRRDDRTGLLAAGILLSFLMFFVIGVFNVLDGPFSLFITGTMVFFFLAYTAASVRRKIALLAVCGAFCGFSFLTKGFLALAIPVVVVVPFLAWERRWKDFIVLPWIPAIVALLVALPWCVAIAFREPDFWRYFFWVEHIERFLKPGMAQHPEPFWFFLPVMIGGALPWTVMLPAAAAGFSRTDLKSSLLRYSICWLVFPFLFFSASSGKLGTYILPCFPPLALLLATGLASYLSSGGRRLFTTAAGLTSAAAAVALAALLVSQLTDIPGFRLYEPDETGKWLPAATGLLAWSALAGVSSCAADWRQKLALFCVAPMLFMSATHMSLSREMDNEKVPEHILSSNTDLITKESLIVSDDYVGPAVCWFFKRSDIMFVGGGGELKMGLQHPDAAGRLLTVDKLSEMINTRRSLTRRNLILIVDYDRFCEYKHMLPKPVVEKVDSGFVFARFRLRMKKRVQL